MKNYAIVKEKQNRTKKHLFLYYFGLDPGAWKIKLAKDVL